MEEENKQEKKSKLKKWCEKFSFWCSNIFKDYKEKKRNEKIKIWLVYLIPIVISSCALSQTNKANKIANKANEFAEAANRNAEEANIIAREANEEAQRSNHLAIDAVNINILSEKITKIQDVYAKNNGQNISSEDKEVLTNIFNSVESLMDINYHDSSPKFVLVKEKSELLKTLIYSYLYKLVPELKPVVAMGDENGAELPITGTLPDLESAFLDYRNTFLNYLLHDNN